MGASGQAVEWQKRAPAEPLTASRAIGLYLHLPFCLRKCAYCDFASLPLEVAGGLSAARRYVNALCIEMDLRAATPEFSKALVDTIYLGGGTPTILPAEWLAELLARVRCRFSVTEHAEVTVEANPGTIDPPKVALLLSAGVNRLSLGVQSLSDQELRTLGRAQSAAEADEAVQAARSAGCRNLSVDLIYGLPNQTLERWRETLVQVLCWQPEHISCYGLTVEEGTPLAAQIEAGQLAPPDEDSSAGMYELAAECLTKAGYVQYEISNFARPGFECQHNRRYWTGGEYLGLGACAHSQRGGVRWNNSAQVPVYTAWLERGRLPVARAEALGGRRRVGEALVLGLRCAEGVSEEEIAARCGMQPREAFGAEIGQLRRQGLLVLEDGRLRLPRRRWLVSNEVLSHFVA